MKLTDIDGFSALEDITEGFYIVPKDIYKNWQNMLAEVDSLRLENRELKKRNAELKIGIGLDPEVFGKNVSDYVMRAMGTNPAEFPKLVGAIAMQDYQNKHPNPPEISETPS